MNSIALNEISLNLMLGVVSSILTLILVWFFRVIWEAKIKPWYEERLYKGSEITGEWETEVEYADGDKNKLIYNLTRKSVRVEGEARCIQGVSEDMRWKLDGYFENLILTLTYRALDRTKLDKGSITLMLVKNGACLDGYLSYYSDNGNCIKSVKMTLNRLPKQKR